MTTHIKLADIQEFTVKSVGRSFWQFWDAANKKMLTSDNYQKDYSLKWNVETDLGQLTLSKDQLSQMLVGVVREGKADIIGKKFSVKTNGKEGKEIRYFLSPIFDKK